MDITGVINNQTENSKDDKTAGVLEEEKNQDTSEGKSDGEEQGNSSIQQIRRAFKNTEETLQGKL
eukprot:13257061-Ditylum_brightwellii.AAC.2